MEVACVALTHLCSLAVAVGGIINCKKAKPRPRPPPRIVHFPPSAARQWMDAKDDDDECFAHLRNHPPPKIEKKTEKTVDTMTKATEKTKVEGAGAGANEENLDTSYDIPKSDWDGTLRLDVPKEKKEEKKEEIKEKASPNDSKASPNDSKTSPNK